MKFFSFFMEIQFNPFYKSNRIYDIITFVFVGKTKEYNSDDNY